jgi:hypothetical protein
VERASTYHAQGYVVQFLIIIYRVLYCVRLWKGVGREETGRRAGRGGAGKRRGEGRGAKPREGGQGGCGEGGTGERAEKVKVAQPGSAPGPKKIVAIQLTYS